MVSRTRRPVGNRVPPSRSQPAFRHVRHSTGDPATARHFTRPSTRDIDRLSSSIQRGCAAIPRPAVWGPIGHCASPVALLLSRFPVPSSGRFVTFRRTTAGYVDRLQAAMGSRHRPGTAPWASRRFPAPLRPCRRSDSDHLGKRYILGRNQESIETRELRLNRECDFLGINIPEYMLLQLKYTRSVW